MQSWSQPSPEPAGPEETESESEELRLMRRRFAEALRRAEIVSLLTGARNEGELGRLLAEELCEAYDAEIGLVLEHGEDGGWRAIAAIGVADGERERLLAAPELAHAAASARAVTEHGADLLGLGAQSLLLAGFQGQRDRGVVIGAARMYPQAFDEAEAALLESVATSAGQGLERLWARDERTELIARLKESFIGTAEALANALEAKDDYTAGHASEVADLAVAVGSEMGLTEEELEDLRYGAIFHDIGKIAIPDAILHKPGPLDPEEREVMMQHPDIGAQIIAPIPLLSDAVKAMVRHDHEHYDGSGYPAGLAGEQIPLGSRIILVVDSFHAMISDRPYREAMPQEEAQAELARCSGTQFDPETVAAFLRVIGKR